MDDSPLIDVCYSMFEEVLGKGHLNQRLPVSSLRFTHSHSISATRKCNDQATTGTQLEQLHRPWLVVVRYLVLGPCAMYSCATGQKSIGPAVV